MKHFLALCSIFALSMMGFRAHAQNNGGFELGDFTGWNTSGTAFVRDFESSRDFLNNPAHSDWLPVEGVRFASLWSTNSTGSNMSSLSRTFTVSAGDRLVFNYFFDFGDVNASDTATGQLSDGTNTVTLFQHNTPTFALSDDQNIEWTPISYTFASAGNYTLTVMTGDGNGTFESVLGVDNVIFNPSSTVPEPSALFAVGIGVTLLGLKMRRRVH